MPDIKTLTISGTTFTVRRPTEAEAIDLQDKRNAVQDPGAAAPPDLCEDGDDVVLACVTSPGPVEAEDVLAFAPMAIGKLEAAVRELGRDGLPIEEDASLLTAELHDKHHQDKLVGIRIGHGKPEDLALGNLDRRLTRKEQARLDAAQHMIPLVLSCIERIEWKMLRREYAGRRIPLSRLCQLAKEHVVTTVEASLWERYPFLSTDLAGYLTKMARGEGEAAAGK